MTQIHCPPLTNCGEKAWGLDGGSPALKGMKWDHVNMVHPNFL